MHDYTLILTLTGGLSAALLLGYITHRLNLSPIVGYLLAGLLIGPYTPGFVADASMAEQFAEIGVILLMFGVGLQFHLEDLLAVRRVAIPGAIFQSACATALGAVLGHAYGWSWSAGIVFGMALSVASTVVLIRILSDHDALHTPAGQIAVGWLVVEDLFTVVALVLLPAMFGGHASASPWMALLVTLGKIAALVAFTALAGARLIPRILDYVAHTRSRELFTLTVLVLALGIAVGSAEVFSVSMALGAFLAGMVVGRSDYSLRAASEALPMRDAFAVLFFVSVGMLLDPSKLFASPLLILGASIIVLVGKPLAALVLVRVMGYPFKTALTVSIALAQIGEFSLIMSTIGTSLGIFPADATNTLVGVAIISIVLNPVVYRMIEPTVRWVNHRPRLAALLNGTPVPADMDAPLPAHHARSDYGAVVIGYGPTGRTVVQLLREHHIVPTVVELNIDTVRELKRDGVNAVYGDVTRIETLQSAGIETAVSLILTSAGMAHTADVIKEARRLNPRLRVLARAGYVHELRTLTEAGADSAYSGEGEVALAFIDDILTTMGATGDQIDRARASAHRELFGAA